MGTRILFIGGTRRGHELLRALFERGEDVVAAYVLAEDPHEPVRWSESIAELTAAHGVETTVCRRLDDELAAAALDRHAPDLILSVGWRTMLPMRLVHGAPLGCVGVHDSLLPRYRGFAPTNWAIINGEAESGVTLFHLSDGVDEGDVVGQVRIPITPRMTAPELYEQVVDASVAVVLDHLDGIEDGTAPRIPQDHTQATYGCARTPEDGELCWHGPTVDADRLIRGLAFPYPGAWTTIDGKRLTVWRARPVEPAPVYAGRIPGRVVGRSDAGVDVLTADGVLRLEDVQLDGDDPRPAADVLRSVKARLGRGGCTHG